VLESFIVNAVVQGMTSSAASSVEVPAVSGRTVHRGPAVRPGSGEPEQVQFVQPAYSVEPINPSLAGSIAVIDFPLVFRWLDY